MGARTTPEINDESVKTLAQLGETLGVEAHTIIDTKWVERQGKLGFTAAEKVLAESFLNKIKGSDSTPTVPTVPTILPPALSDNLKTFAKTLSDMESLCFINIGH